LLGGNKLWKFICLLHRRH